MKKEILLVLLATSASTLFAATALEPVYPVGGQTVALVPDAQKQVMKLPTLAERLKLFADDREDGRILAHDQFWRKSLPFVLKVKLPNGDSGVWKVLIGKRPDLSDARTWYLESTKTDSASGREIKGSGARGTVSIEVPLANLEIATHYYWKAIARGRCGFGCGVLHGCKESKMLVETPVSDFVTEDFAPRWIAIEGRVNNMRDFGGRLGMDGKRIRQGLIFRGQGLNDNSVTGEAPGRNRLTVEDVKYLTGTLGIKTDLDLRGKNETAGMSVSPLGPGVTYIRHSTLGYKEMFSPSGKKMMADNFRVFCNRKNYPIYVHCIGGADRTGSLVYLLLGVLGVDRQLIETDWEATFYPKIPDENPDPDYWCRESHFNTGFAKYGKANSTWNERIVLYLKDCGISEAEIATFRKIMLDK